MNRIDPDKGIAQWDTTSTPTYRIFAPYLQEDGDWQEEDSGCEAREIDSGWLVSDPDDGFFLATHEEVKSWTMIPKS